MEQEKQDLVERAVSKYGSIQPIASKRSLEECFTVSEKKLIFWFNDKEGNTKVVYRNRRKT